jgi:hypothetical protein
LILASEKTPYGFSVDESDALLNVFQPLNTDVYIWVPLLSFKFRLYPTKEQEFALEQTLDGGRWVYNSLNHLHNGLQLLRIPAERRESAPVETAMQSKKQEATVRAW